MPEPQPPLSVVNLGAADPAALALAACGLTIPADEVTALSAQYPAIRASLDLLYDPAFADADPFLQPDPALCGAAGPKEAS